MTTRRKIIGLATAALAAGALAGGVAYGVGGTDDDSPAEKRAELEFTRAHQDEATVTKARAEALALEERPGTVLESELEGEGGGLVWEVEIDAGGAVWEVTVDALDGRVLETESEGNEAEEKD